MRSLMLIVAAATIASCSRPAAPPGTDLAEALAGRVAGPPQTCVTSYPSQNLNVLDSQTVSYGFGRTIYVSRLQAACPGISQFNTLIVEPGLPGEYCRNDRIRGLEPGTTIPGPSCNLGEWVPYRRP